MIKFSKRTLCIGLSIFLVLSLAGTSALMKSAAASFSDYFAFAQDVESSSERAPHKDECFVSDDNDEGRNIVFKVIDESNRLVQVGCGSSGKTYVINDEDADAEDRVAYATITDTFSGTLTIPEQVTYAGVTYTVTKIASSAFASYKDNYADITFKLKKLVLPSTVTEIGDNAFYMADLSAGIAFSDECNLTTIGNSAFNTSGIYTFAIPESLTSLGNSAFYSCENLNKVTFPQNCKLSELPSYTFYSCKKLFSVDIPNSITSIEESTFQGCRSLITVVIPETITSIDRDSFAYCDNLSSIKVDSNNTVYDSRNNCNAIIETNTNTLVLGCKDTTIPNTVTSIGENAFNGSSITSITIPKSVVSIKWYAFLNSQELQNVYYLGSQEQWSKISIDDGNEYLTNANIIFVDENNFWKTLDKSQTNIEIPYGITSIPEAAFSG